MNLAKTKQTARRHMGLLMGGGLGLLSGLHIFGLAIGFLLGYFADEIFHARRTLKCGSELMSSGNYGDLDERWIPLVLCVALACATATEDGKAVGQSIKELLKDRIAAGLGIEGREAGLIGQLVDRYFSLKPAPVEQLSKLFKERTIDVQQADLIKLLFAVGTRQNRLIKEISVLLEMPAVVFNRILSQTVAVDTEAYETLGVSPEATDQEIRTVYRRLASQFHPDTGGDLDQHQQEQSREAFMRIKNALNRIMEGRGNAPLEDRNATRDGRGNAPLDDQSGRSEKEN